MHTEITFPPCLFLCTFPDPENRSMSKSHLHQEFNEYLKFLSREEGKLLLKQSFLQDTNTGFFITRLNALSESGGISLYKFHLLVDNIFLFFTGRGWHTKYNLGTNFFHWMFKGQLWIYLPRYSSVWLIISGLGLVMDIPKSCITSSPFLDRRKTNLKYWLCCGVSNMNKSWRK